MRVVSDPCVVVCPGYGLVEIYWPGSEEGWGSIALGTQGSLGLRAPHHRVRTLGDKPDCDLLNLALVRDKVCDPCVVVCPGSGWLRSTSPDPKGGGAQ